MQYSDYVIIITVPKILCDPCFNFTVFIPLSCLSCSADHSTSQQAVVDGQPPHSLQSLLTAYCLVFLALLCISLVVWWVLVLIILLLVVWWALVLIILLLVKVSISNPLISQLLPYIVLLWCHICHLVTFTAFGKCSIWWKSNNVLM